MHEQRVGFVMAVSRKEKDFQKLCQEFAISRPTGYRWWKRFQEQGIAGMQERSRRPHHSPGRTPSALEQPVVELRKKRPDWGARKLHVLLQRKGVELPTGTIHRILLRHDLVREQDRVRPAVKRFERAAPNQLWQMDFKGPKGWDQPLGPLTVLDDHSRYALALRATRSTGEAVREVLQQVFAECGLPEQMLMDHGCPWWNEQGTRGWTRLAVWLMKHDIQLHFSRYHHPQTQGKVEHLHRSLTAALLRRGTPPDEQRQTWLDEFRYEHNHVRPHQALGMRTPDQFWAKSARSYASHPVPWNYPEGYQTAEVHSSGEVKIERRYYWVSATLAGEQVGLVEAGGRILVYYRRSLVRELDPRPPAESRRVAA